MRTWPRRLFFGLLFCAPVGFAGNRHWRAEQALFLPGRTSDGHHQIENDCATCHTPFGGVSEASCLGCHGESLRARNDSHAPAKFDDPVRALQLTHVDARSCVACHREHRAEARLRGSVSEPQTFCIACHADVREDRPSHATFDDAGCASAGCHNYHDNRGLYRDFLLKDRGAPELRADPRVPLPPVVLAPTVAAAIPPPPDFPATSGSEPGPEGMEPEQWNGRMMASISEWTASAHARAQVNCTGCHERPLDGDRAPGVNAPSPSWSWTVNDTVCANCHRDERLGFRDGKHGMRLVAGHSAMSPSLARAPMKPQAKEEGASRTLGCTTCHGSHRFDRVQAAVTACEGCHDDSHTRAYRTSAHFNAWRDEQRHEAAPGTGVSCATCHLPRQLVTKDGAQVIKVEHNQNGNLRPSDRMWRDVCIHCHGASFSLDALADPALVQTNFQGRPAPAVTSMDLIDKLPR